MRAELVPIGLRGVVAANRIVAIMDPHSAPIKRMVRQGKEEGTVIDLTYGRRTRAVLVMDSGHITLLSISPGTIVRLIGQHRERTTGLSDEPG